MILREPISGTLVILFGLSLAFGWTLGLSIWNGTLRTCEHTNVEHLKGGYEGPVKPCP